MDFKLVVEHCCGSHCARLYLLLGGDQLLVARGRSHGQEYKDWLGSDIHRLESPETLYLEWKSKMVAVQDLKARLIGLDSSSFFYPAFALLDQWQRENIDPLLEDEKLKAAAIVLNVAEDSKQSAINAFMKDANAETAAHLDIAIKRASELEASVETFLEG